MQLILNTLCMLCLLALHTSASALTLKEAMELALRNDPTFLAAQANLNVSRERVAQALAGIYPQITVSANTTANRRTYTLRSTPPPTSTPTERYNSNSAQLNFTQPIWRRSSTIAWSQSNMAMDQADFQLTAAAQDLLVRLAQAWFDVMQARDAQAATAAQVQAAQQQLELSQRGRDRGVLSLTELEDARAKQQQAIAEHAVAQSEVEIKLAALEQIIGTASHTPPVLSEKYTAASFSNETLDLWLAQAEDGNPSLLAAMRAVDAANEEIRKQRAGHEPTLDMVASYGKTSQEAGISGGQSGFDSFVSTIGIQLNMPLFAGGGQSAKVREALSLRDKALQELEAARRNARLSAKQAWFTWRASQVRENSTKQVVQSAVLALNGAQSARERGVKSDVDVAQAAQQHAAAVRDWRKARYDGIISQIKLKAACGQLRSEELLALDKAFVPAEH